MPPRYGKTELAVINWIAQCIGRNPKAKFIHLSYSSELALDNSGKCRELILSQEFQELWPVQLKQDSKSKQKWYTAQGGGVYATQAGGAITGFGAGITVEDDNGLFGGAIIIDDPLKPDDARSEIERKKVNERLNETIKSRRNSRSTPIIIIMQRLHEEDMSGFVLEGRMGEEFHHLKLPALGADGKALWPIKHSVEELKAMQAHPESRITFATQYQQEPTPDDGYIIRRDWFQYFEQLPPRVCVDMVVHSWDTAYKPGQLNDPSCCTVWHIQGGVYFLAEVIVQRMEYPELKQQVKMLAERDRPDAILIEDKASGQSLIQELRVESPYPVIAIKVEGDKLTRASAASAAFEGQKILMNRHAAWLNDYESELLHFPNGKHDDQVDSTSQFIRWARDNVVNMEQFTEALKEYWA